MGFPHTAQLGRLPGTAVFRNVKQYPEAQQYPGILAVRIDAPLYYANVPVTLRGPPHSAFLWRTPSAASHGLRSCILLYALCSYCVMKYYKAFHISELKDD